MRPDSCYMEAFCRLIGVRVAIYTCSHFLLVRAGQLATNILKVWPERARIRGSAHVPGENTREQIDQNLVVILKCTKRGDSLSLHYFILA